MRSVPTNPATGEPLVRMPGDEGGKRTALLLGGATGALVGSAMWALGRRRLGWYGAVVPVIGAIGGMLSWSAFEHQAMR